MAAIEPDHDPRYDQSKRDRAKALYDEGHSVREVAEELGVSARRAWVFLHEAGVVMRPGEQAEERRENVKASNVGRYWASYSWPTEAPSIKAFERCLAEVPYIGMWRSRHPMRPPHTHYTVFLMAESQEALKPAIDLCVLLGAEWYEPEPGLIDTLRQRRRALAIEAIAKGTDKLVTRGRPRTMDKAGRMHDYEGEVE